VSRRDGAALALLAALLFATTAAEAQTERASEAPARCTSYVTGEDTRTDCESAGPAVPAPAIHCTVSKTGNDTHTECAPTAGPITIGTRRRDPVSALPTVPPPPIRCYSYAIGASVYTDCR
jgi:hypothetical protein